MSVTAEDSRLVQSARGAQNHVPVDMAQRTGNRPTTIPHHGFYSPRIGSTRQTDRLIKNKAEP